MLSFANISLALLRHGNIIKRRKLFCRCGFVEGGFDGGGWLSQGDLSGGGVGYVLWWVLTRGHCLGVFVLES